MDYSSKPADLGPRGVASGPAWTGFVALGREDCGSAGCRGRQGHFVPDFVFGGSKWSRPCPVWAEAARLLGGYEGNRTVQKAKPLARTALAKARGE